MTTATVLTATVLTIVWMVGVWRRARRWRDRLRRAPLRDSLVAIAWLLAAIALMVAAQLVNARVGDVADGARRVTIAAAWTAQVASMAVTWRVAAS